MTSSTKPEVQNILYCRFSEDDRVMTTGNIYRNFLKFGYVIFEICQQTDAQTVRHTDTLTAIPLPAAK